MTKYKVGVGDAFPLETERMDAPETPDNDGGDPREARRRRARFRHFRSAFLFEATFILLAIWGALHLINGYAPRGLLIAAAITFGVGLVRRLFWRSHWERHEWRLERRRAWRD